MLKFKPLLLLALVAYALGGAARAADPGQALPPGSPLSDQKTGSVLLFSLYSSSASAPGSEDTRFAITNTERLNPARLQLFFINGTTGAIRSNALCLAPLQTKVLLASVVDPGTRGYVVAVAVDAQGLPVNFNFLQGEADIKLATGQRASLKAQAVAALNLAPVPNPGSPVTLNFDGVQYNKLPRVLGVDRLASAMDGNATLLFVNRLSDLVLSGTGGTAASTGALFGIVYDDRATPFSFSLVGAPQIAGTVSDDFPRTTPRLSQIVPAGRTAWFKVYNQTANVALCGAWLNFNANSGTDARAFTGGHNLHALTLTTASMTMAVVPPAC